MKFIFFLLLAFSYFSSKAQIYKYTNDKGGQPDSWESTTTVTPLTRVQGATKPNFSCSTGFSSQGFPKSSVFAITVPAIQYEVTADAGYELNITSLKADLRKSGSGAMSVTIGFTLNGTTWVISPTYTPNNGGCGETITANWDIPDMTCDKITVRLYGYNASSGSGTLQILNVFLNGTVISKCDQNVEICNAIDDNCNGKIDEGEIKYYFDGNGDSFADDPENYIFSVCTSPPTNYVTELAPVADVKIVDTKLKIPEALWTGTVADLAYTGSTTAPCNAKPRETTSEPIYSLVTGLNWNYLSQSEGQTCQIDWVLVGNTLVLRAKTATDTCGGYNCCEIGGLVIKGACQCDWLINGKLLDFFNDYVALLQKSGMKAIVTANVERGTAKQQWEQADWKMYLTNADMMILGQEEKKPEGHFDGDPKKYLNGIEPIIDSLAKKYPWVIPIYATAQIYQNDKNSLDWNKQIFASKNYTNPSKKVASTLYLQLDESTNFIGKVGNDTIELNAVPNRHTAWFDKLDSMSNHKPIAVTQANCAETFSDDPNAIVYPGQFIAGAYLVLTYWNALQYNATNDENRIILIIWQTIKNVTGKGVYDLNGNLLQVISSIFKPDATYFLAEHKHGYLIFGSKKGDEYNLVFFNKASKDLTLPNTVNFDGYTIRDIKWQNYNPDFRGSSSYTDTKIAPYAYDPANKTIRAYSIGKATVKIQLPQN